MTERHSVGWRERLGPCRFARDHRTSSRRILSVLKRRERNQSEPDTAWTLPADSNFGRGFDSRRSTNSKLLKINGLEFRRKIWARLYSHCTVALQDLPQFGDSSRISLKSGCSCFPSIPATIQIVRTPTTKPGVAAAAPSGYGDRSTANSFARALGPTAGKRLKNFAVSSARDLCRPVVRLQCPSRPLLPHRRRRQLQIPNGRESRG